MKVRLVVAVTAIAVVAFAAGALATGGFARNDGRAARSPVRATKVPAVDAPNARAAAFVAGNVLVRSKGFTTFTHPGVGIYCLKFKDQTIRPAAIAPVATVEWGNSGGNDLMVNWDRSAQDCGSTGAWLEIQTFDESAGWTFSDSVAFDVVVP